MSGNARHTSLDLLYTHRMQARSNTYPFPLRILICLLALIILIPPCIAQSPAPHKQMPAGMTCCPATSSIQSPQTCCTLHPQPADLFAATPLLTIPVAANHVLPESAPISTAPPHQIRTTVSPPPLLHPILRI